MLDRLDLAALRGELQRLNLDGWLLYDFRGNNPIARRLLGVGGMATRRLFVYLPADGDPVAIAHQIELQGLADFPGTVQPYAAWPVLHEHLRGVVQGRKIAMEVFENDQVPYLDWVPHGVVQLIQSLGGTIESSTDLVTAFAAKLSDEEIAGHLRSSEIIAEIARSTLLSAVSDIGVRETAIQTRVTDAMGRAGLIADHPPIVAFGAHAANPHYEPGAGSDAALESDQVILLDLFASEGEASVSADQTWMGFAGSNPPDEVVRVWETVRDARKAAVAHLEAAHQAGRTVSGADLDDAAREVVSEAGYGEWFVHRTGHSIDLQLHGSGPHLDNFESQDVREIVPGIAFSVEPGVYLPGRFGVRSEINVVMLENGPQPTPAEAQEALILA